MTQQILCSCENSPDSTILHLIKSKFPGGACLQTPLVCHMFCTWYILAPPRNPYNLILSPLGQKAERNPGGCHPLNRTVYHCIAQVEKNALAEEAKCHTQSPWEKTEREAGEGAHRKGLAQVVKLVTIIMLSYHTRTSDSKWLKKREEKTLLPVPMVW